MTPTLPQPSQPQQAPQPQQQGQPASGSLSADDSPQLFDQLKAALKKIVDDDIHGDVDPEKIQQYSDLRKGEFYWRGQQFLRKVVAGDGQMIDWEPINSGTVKAGEQSTDLYDYVINDYRGYGRKFVGVMAQQSPNLKFRPNKDGDDAQMRHAKTAQRIWGTLRSTWEYERQNRLLFFGFYKSGTQFAHQVFVADGEKYGYSEEPVMEMQDTPIGPARVRCMGCGQEQPIPEGQMPPQSCPQCGREYGPEDYLEPETAPMPVQTGTKRYPNGAVENHLYSSLQVTTPFWIRGLTDTPWLELHYEEFKGRVLSAYADKPGIYQKLREISESENQPGVSSAESYGKYTRQIVSSPHALVRTTRRNCWTWREIYMRSSNYETIKDSSDVQDETGQRTEARLMLKERFPDGLKMFMVNNEVIEIKPCRLDDEWRMAVPEVCENAYPDPLGKDMMPSQDLVNTCYNLMVETLERQIPQTFVDVDRINLKAREKHMLPAGMIPVRRIAGTKLGDAIERAQVAKSEPEQVQYPEMIREHSAENIGITRAIYGGAGKGQQETTAYATNLKRNQAMLQLAPALDAAREFWAGCAHNAVMMFAEKSDGRIPTKWGASTEFELSEVKELLAGDWWVEPDDAMPMSWSERRATLLEMYDKGPLAQQALGFNDIENIPLLQNNLVGIDDWKVPNEDALDKVHQTIEKLLQQQPVTVMAPGPPVVDPASGMPMPGPLVPQPMPSVPVDEFEDDHMFSAQVVRNWAQTAGRIREENPAGYANVILWGKGHAQMAMPPPGMPPGSPAPGATPPGPAAGVGATGPPAGNGGPPAPAGGGTHLMPPSGGDTAKATRMPQ